MALPTSHAQFVNYLKLFFYVIFMKSIDPASLDSCVLSFLVGGA